MDALVSHGLLQGSENGMEPGRQVTRAEAAVMALALCGVQPEPDIPAFTDIEGHWSSDAITYAYRQDYFFLLWKLKDVFEPERKVGGEELGWLLLRVMGYGGWRQNAETARPVKYRQIRQLLSQVWRFSRKEACKIYYTVLTSLTADEKSLYKQLCEKGILEEAVCGKLLGISDKIFGDC